MTQQGLSTDPAQRTALLAFNVLVGLASLAVLFQGVWAGMFIREGHENDDSWVNVHARGADVAIGLAALATVVAVARLRHQRSLIVLTGAFTVLLILESYLGGLVGDHNVVEVIHFPLAMALLALAAYIPLKARTLRQLR